MVRGLKQALAGPVYGKEENQLSLILEREKKTLRKCYPEKI